MPERVDEFLKDCKGLSSAAAQALMIAGVIIIVAVLTNYAMTTLPTRHLPQLQLAVDGGGGNITITHMGGDAVAYGDLAIVVYGKDGSIVDEINPAAANKLQITSIPGYDTEMFENGESIVFQENSGNYKVAVLYKPLSKTIATKNVYVT